VRDVVHQRGHLPFVQRENPVLNVVRIHAVVGPDHAHDRNVDFGEDIHRHVEPGADTQNTEQRQHGGNRIRVFQNVAWQRHSVDSSVQPGLFSAASV
jgi:hypothetical protein